MPISPVRCATACAMIPDAKTHQVAGVETRLNRIETQEAVNHEPSPGEKDERARNLHDDKAAAQPLMRLPGGGAAGRVAQRVHQIGPRRLRRRSDPEDQTCEHGEGDGEGENRPVDCELAGDEGTRAGRLLTSRRIPAHPTANPTAPPIIASTMLPSPPPAPSDGRRTSPHRHVQAAIVVGRLCPCGRRF